MPLLIKNVRTNINGMIFRLGCLFDYKRHVKIKNKLKGQVCSKTLTNALRFEIIFLLFEKINFNAN